MLVRRFLSTALGLILACAMLPLAAHADDYNQSTKLHFNEPVELPHHTILPAGSYWFVLASTQGDRNVVEIFNGNWSKLYATLLTVPTLRDVSTSQPQVTFAERPANKPEALLKWYYPGRVTGHEFLYGPRHEREFAHDQQIDTTTTSLKSRS